MSERDDHTDAGGALPGAEGAGGDPILRHKAHELNNMLAAVVMYAEMAAADCPADERLQQDLRRILEASGQAIALTREILDHARRS